MKIFITGVAGFVGFHLTKHLLANGYDVVGIDNLNSYYDPELKKNRIKILLDIKNDEDSSSLDFYSYDLNDSKEIDNIFSANKFDAIIHLAAQAGVRYSIKEPMSYVDSNLRGFSNMVEIARKSKVQHFIFASSSSVYGMNNNTPFSTEDNTDYPVSLYAATKKSNEVQAFSYSHLYDIPMTGLRFFTVYGPWGRPDMAYFTFTKKIINGTPIELFNNGNMIRDFTYIDDIVEAIKRLIQTPPKQSDHKGTSAKAPYRLVNIGNNNPISLTEFIDTLESAIGIKAIRQMEKNQLGDVPITYANVDELNELIGFSPSYSLSVGLKNFVNWYNDYYKKI
jgi:UDP-glucuronate 4-epimerase